MNKNNIIVILAALLLLGLATVAATGKAPATSSEPTAKAVNVPASGTQEVTLRYENYEYKLQPSTLIKGVPVRMTVDLSSVTGCMRDVVISSFGVRKYVREGDNTITFTPDKTGTFGIACSMNMGRGRFDVIEADGSTSGFVEKTPAATGGSCGAGGGCGCGG